MIQRNAHIVVDTEVDKSRWHLEFSADAFLDNLEFLQLQYVADVRIIDFASRWFRLAADDVEQCRLACSVRTDEEVDFMRRDRSRHIVDGLEAIEFNGYVLEAQERICGALFVARMKHHDAISFLLQVRRLPPKNAGMAGR